MYYNPNTKQTITLLALRKLLNASIPSGTEKVQNWYLIHNDEQPEVTDTQRVVPDAIVRKNKVYTQTWKIESIPAEELAELQAEEAAIQAEQDRIPDLEDAVIDLADYITELEARILALEDK